MGETTLDLIRFRARLAELKMNTKSIVDQIENIEKELETIIEKENPDQVEDSASTNFTYTDEKSISDKINESQFTKPKIIRDTRTPDERKMPTVLIGTDGSLVGRKSRTVATCSVIFGEASILNTTFKCNDTSSSTIPEIMAILEAIKIAKDAKLDKIVIATDSHSAMNFIEDIGNSPVLTKKQSKIAEKSNAIKDTTEETRSRINAFKYLILVHQKSHTGRAFDKYTRLNELADITAKEKAIAELSKLFPRRPPNEEDSANENS